MSDEPGEEDITWRDIIAYIIALLTTTLLPFLIFIAVILIGYILYQWIMQVIIHISSFLYPSL